MKKWKVLLADDSPLAREKLRKLLEETGAQIQGEADNGAEVLQLLSEGLHTELITMDIEMPEMDGIAATRQIIETYPDVAVLVVSSYANEKVFDAIEAGATWHLQKPIQKEKLLEALEKVEQMYARTKLHWDA